MTPLKEYANRRKFGQTPEPQPQRGSEEQHLVFVVHKHAARRLHYDLRLELGGVLKSWAVPKGPSMDPSIKRLAVMVEDHPLDYRDFEGVIPEGNYGAGSVIIWDRGFYQHPSAGDRKASEKLLRDGLRKGDMKLVLAGEKLRGEFALVRLGSDEKSWLLMKKKDRYAGTTNILKERRSVISGATLEETLRSEEGKGSRQKIAQHIRLREAMESVVLRSADRTPMPHRIHPMLATVIQGPFNHPDWVFEVKWDGYRAVAEIRDGEVALYSRNLISLNKKFPVIIDSLRKFGFEAVLDGEIVAVDNEGRPNFQMLQNFRQSGEGYLLYYVFDLVYFQGHDLTSLPLLKRKGLLQKILPSNPRIRFSEHIVKDGVPFFNAVREKGLEGIVAKYSPSLYETGKRSRHWLKVKTYLAQEAVIAGFTAPRKGRKYFGSLVLGVYEGDKLIYIGHSGGGFVTKGLKELYETMQPRIRNTCPFKQEPPTDTSVTWLKPELVCEVALSGWTEEGIMRHPVFLRLRNDKPAREVMRERS